MRMGDGAPGADASRGRCRRRRRGRGNGELGRDPRAQLPERVHIGTWPAGGSARSFDVSFGWVEVRKRWGRTTPGAAGWGRREVCLEGGNGTNNNYLTC